MVNQPHVKIGFTSEFIAVKSETVANRSCQELGVVFPGNFAQDESPRAHRNRRSRS